MRNYIYAFMGMAVIALSGCGQQKNKNSESDQEEFLKANSIIVYANNIIAEYNRISNWDGRSDRYVVQLAEIANDPKISKDPLNLSFFMMNSFDVLDAPLGGTPIDLTQGIDVLPDEAKTYFLKSTEAYTQNKTGLLRVHDAIKEYVEKENYKDDKGALGKLYADSVGIFYLGMLDVINEMVEVAGELGQEAELETLKTSPIYDLIVFMRSEMTASENLIIALYKYNEGDVSKDEISSLYDSYLKLISANKNKSANLKVPDTKKSAFQNFMNSSDKIATEFIKANRSVVSGEKVEAQVLSIAQIYYEALIKEYNFIV